MERGHWGQGGYHTKRTARPCAHPFASRPSKGLVLPKADLPSAPLLHLLQQTMLHLLIRLETFASPTAASFPPAQSQIKLSKPSIF